MSKKILVIVLIAVIGFSGYRVWQHNKTTASQNTSTTNNPTENTSSPSFDKNQRSLSEPESIWVVVNKARPLKPLEYTPDDLVDVGNGQQMKKEAATAFSKMLKAAAKEKLTILPLSGYRSYDTQIEVYNNEIARYGQAVADTQSARPGHSEHQTGFGIDVGGGGCGIEDCFGDTAEGKWVANNGYKYGFIIRYPKGKDSVTGYRPEPWHLRYVGKELAQELHDTKTSTLEEFFDIIPEKQPY